MKKIKLIGFSLMIAATLFTGCGSDNSSLSSSEEITTAETTEVVVTMAVDTLSSGEKDVYNALIDFSSYLKNPASIQLVDLAGTTNPCFLKISGENSFGGTDYDWYEYKFIFDENNTITHGKIGKLDPVNAIMLETSLESGAAPNWDIGLINATLEEYFN